MIEIRNEGIIERLFGPGNPPDVLYIGTVEEISGQIENLKEEGAYSLFFDEPILKIGLEYCLALTLEGSKYFTICGQATAQAAKMAITT